MAFPFTGRIEILWLLIAETSWAYWLLLRLPKGLPRLLGLLPLLPPSLLVPWRAPTVCERILLSFLFLWMVGAKLLMLVWDTGPAADPEALASFPRFFFAISSSVHLKRSRQVSPFYRDQHYDAANLKDGLAEVKDATGGKSGNEGINGSSKSVIDGISGEIGRNGSSKSGTDGISSELARNGSTMSGTDGIFSELGRNGSSNFGTDGQSSGLFRRKNGPQDNGELVEHAGGLQVEGSKTRRTAKGGVIFGWVQTVERSQTGWIVFFRSILYFVLGSSLVQALLVWKTLMPEYVVVLVLSFGLYFGCLFVFEMAGAIAGCLLGVKLRPQFNMPFLADSLADFWGRRWNLLVNNLLRVSVYEPVLALLNGSAKPTQWERAVATAAAFLVSGLMHEVFVFYGSRGLFSWEMTAYFVVNGAATIVEGFVVKPGKSCRVPRLLRRVYTLSFVYLTACWLFFPPLFRTGMIDSALKEVRALVSWLSLGTIIL